MILLCFFISVDNDEMQEDTPIELTPELATKIEWLQTNDKPKHVVADYMLSTAKYRQKWIRESDRSVSEILKEFPHLLNPNMVRKFLYHIIFYSLALYPVKIISKHCLNLQCIEGILL